MGSINITSIKRRQFASSVVGTPGVDNAGALALNSLANSSFGIGRKFQQNEILTNRVQAAKEAQVTEEEVQKNTANIQAMYNADSSLDPAEGIRLIKEEEKLIRNRRLTEIGNRKVRGMTSLLHQGNSVRSANANNKWALKLQGINMLSNGTEAINILATQAEQTPDFDTFTGILRQGEQIGKTTAVGLNARQGAKFVKDSPESIARGYLNGRMKRDPEQGLEEFKSQAIFSNIFDSDERKKIETAFVKAIQGKNELTNYQSKLDLAQLNKEASEDTTLLNNIDWVLGQKQRLSDISLLPSGAIVDGVKMSQQDIKSAEADYDRQATSILKNNKLTAKLDPQMLIDLATEFANFGLKADGTFKNNADPENFTDTFDFTMRLQQARVDGKIDDAAYKSMAKPLQIATENASAEAEAEGAPGLLTKIADALTPTLSRERTDFSQNPTAFGINSIDDYLSSLNIANAVRKRRIRGALINDLFFLVAQDPDVTREGIRANLTKIYKDNASRFGIPLITDDAKAKKFKDPLTGLTYRQLSDGIYIQVE